MISYSLDYYWSFDADKTMSQIRNLPKIASIDERSRISDSHLPEIYDQFVLYIAYVLYLPLYIAGPIMTFNNFVSHLIIPQRNYSLNQKVKYAALRFCIPFALFFIGTHYVYVSAIANMGYTYFIRDIDGPVPLIEKLVNDGWLDVKFVYIYTYYTLLYLYLKFLVIWRFFRLWAIFDDVEPCENMGHCIVNTHSLSGFWRSWHKSFNQWLIRYMYIPLGGNKFGFSRQVLSIIVIFTFVSFWHDLTMKLFTWGCLFMVFFIPELIIKAMRNWGPINLFLNENKLIDTYLTTAFSVMSLIVLMVSNAVGYSIGMPVLAMLYGTGQDSSSQFFCFKIFFILMLYCNATNFIKDTCCKQVSVKAAKLNLV